MITKRLIERLAPNGCANGDVWVDIIYDLADLIFKEEKLSGYEDVTSKVKSYFKKIIFKPTDSKNTNLIPTGFLYGTLNDDGVYVEKPLHAEVAHETFWNDVSEKSRHYDISPAYCLDMLEEKRLDFFSSVIYNEYDMVYGNDQRFQKLN